ncbi:MAG: phosphatidate cytidylyltransferase [Christensenellales bacterium]
MSARIITGVGLLGLLFVALYFGGWVFSLLWIACVCIALYENVPCVVKSRAPPGSLATWAALIIAIPGFLYCVK